MCRVFYLLQQFETVVLSPEWKREFSICNIKNRDVYGSGAVVDWRSSIVDRFFSIEDRRKEYSDLYIRRIFSEINPNFASRVYLRKEKAIICFHNEECGQDFLVEFKEKNNVFEIAFDNLEPLLEGRYELVFSFLHSQEKAISMNGNPMSLLVIQKDQQGEFSAVDIEGNVQGQCDFDKKNNRIRIRIPLESLYLFDRMIAYNILLRERVYQNYFRWCGGLYENYNPKGNLGILIV